MNKEILANTTKIQSFSISQLREYVYNTYHEKFIGKCVTNEHLGIQICFINDGARKIAYGGALYSKKACLIEVLHTMIKKAKFNNWGNRKTTDKNTVVGYLNFK